MRKRTWIIIFSSIFFLIVAMLIANITLRSVVEKKLRASLQQFQPFVNAGFSQAQINLFAGSVQLDSLYISFDPELKQEHTHTIQSTSVTISDIHFFKLIMHKEFSAGLLSVNNADIKLDHDLLNKKFTLPDSIIKKIQLPFRNASIDNIKINDIKIAQQNNEKVSTICTGNVSFTDVYILKMDSSFSKDSIHFSNVRCDLNDIKYSLQNYYSVQLKKFHVDGKDSVMELNELKLIPQLGKYEMGQKLGKQTDHIDASVNNIKISGLDVKQLMQKKFTAQQLSINNPVIYVFRDRRLPLSQEKQPTTLDYLQQVPYTLNVLHFDLNNATVTSEEFPKEGNKSGYIKLYHVYISMNPLLNHATKTISSINSHVKASIMNAGNIHANINLSLINGNSYIKGGIDELHLTAMNPSAENLGKFHIKSGVLNKLDFEFTATDTKAKGQIIGEYHDLVIDRLKLTKDGELKTAKLPSFLLHKIIIPKNKDAAKDVKNRTGKIDYDRDPTRLVTFYYLKALLDGIRDSFALGFVLPK